jgi:hypothetical protein
MKISSFRSVIIVLTFVAIPCLSYSQTGGSTDPAKMASDQASCQEHATASSGYDPANPEASVETGGPPPQRGAGLRGAARGAAKGAVVGGTVEHFGDDRRGDATEIGAATGALAGGARSRRQAKDQAEAQQDQAISSGTSAYTNSYNECMASRGY